MAKKRRRKIKAKPPKKDVSQNESIIPKVVEQKKSFIVRFSKKSIQFYLLLLVAGLAIVFAWIMWGIPLPDRLTQNQVVSTKIFDRNGRAIYEIYASERRTPISLSEIPQNVKNATIAIEDKEFYKHRGFSLTGIARALYKTVSGKRLEGGSTLTQQLVKNSLLTPERTIRRKIREFFLSLLVEARYSKDQILELYLNQIPYGSTAYGVESASQMYFGKSVKDLNLAEAALLAGLPASPTKLSPFGTTPERAIERQKIVLSQMKAEGMITEEEMNSALNTQITYAKPEDLSAPHFALWIKEQLAETYGDAVVEQGGLRITTTLDYDLQEFAQNAVATEVAKLKKQKVGNGAMIVTSPSNGEILAMVGSKDYFATDEDGKVNIVLAKRQPGSSIKPINYALALRDRKITLSTPLADIPTCFKVTGQPEYCPVNYDGKFHGSVQARFALGNSFNIPAVRILALNGLENFVNFARDMGLSTLEDPSRYGLSLTLGGGEVRPIDMALAYGVFANGGIRQNLVSILKIEDWKGNKLYEIGDHSLNGPRILDPEVAYLINHTLSDNNARLEAFGPSSYLNVKGYSDVSVKTGTTNDRRDNWTAGFTPEILGVVWVGNNDNSPMSGAVSGVSGASPIWNKVMKYALDNTKKHLSFPKDVVLLKQPQGVTGSLICANTGFLKNEFTSDCPERFEFFLADTIPQGGARREDIPFDRESGSFINDSAKPENIEPQNHLVVSDPLGSIICLDCQFPMGKSVISYPFVQ